MTSRPLRIIDIHSEDPLSMGHQHGETYRQQIAELADIRMERMCETSRFSKTRDVLQLAQSHLPKLQAFDVDLFLELRGISEASQVSLERLVVLNHFTDMRDIVPNPHRSGNNEDIGGCSIIFAQGSDGPILGQTWDIHGSAEPYVIMMRMKDILVFSVTGCLGMTGLNTFGVSIAINNLVSLEAKVGIMWPALVRKSLTHRSAALAKDEVMAADLGSGRHFAIADPDHFYGIEAGTSNKKIICDQADATYIHTNHCVDPEMKKTHTLIPGSSSLSRYQHLDEVVRHKHLASAQEVLLALAEVSTPVDEKDVHKSATCGTLVMDINRRLAIGCQGIADQELLKWAQTTIRMR